MTKKQASRQAVFTERDIDALEWAVNRARSFTPKIFEGSRSTGKLQHAEEALKKLTDMMPSETQPPFDAN